MKKITLIIALCFIAQFVKSQNTCATAVPINVAGNYVVGPINGALPSPICANNGAGATFGEWYVYTPTQNYTVTISTDIAANTPRVDTRFHVYSGTCTTLNCYSGDDDSGTSYSSIKTFNVFAGTSYIIAWDNKWSSNGFTFLLTENAFIPEVPTPISYTNQNITTINSTYNLCIVDMNGEHKDDIVGVSANNLRIHNQGTAGALTVTNFAITGTSKMPSWSIAAGDYNKDGYNDLLLGSGDGLSFWKSNNTGTAYTSATPGQYIFCQRTNFIDINNDGHLDAFSCHDVAPNVYYLNNGTGNFTYYQSGVTAGAYSLGITPGGGNYASLWTDYDNDGDNDMFISKCSGPPCELHRNDGGGVFTDISAIAQINVTPIQSWSSAIADFDNDGDMDILIGSNGSVGNKFFLNNLNTTNSVEEPFTNITAGSGWDTNTSINRDYISYDFDNNGLIDVMGSGGKIMFNQGNNIFSPVTYSSLNIGAIGDLNSDGFLDFLNGSTIKYAVPNGNNWITMDLQGIQSNRNGIGTRIEIHGAWGIQIREIRSGEGFEFMSTLNAHFGLGLDTAISQVIIKWPSGIVDTINNPAINQNLHIVEGSTLAVDSYTNSEFSLYPNPAKNILNIKANDNLSLTLAQVYDLNGKMILKSDLSTSSINVESLMTGTYILLLRDSNGKDYAQKFLKE